MNTHRTHTDECIDMLHCDIVNMMINLSPCNRLFQVTKTVVSIIYGIKHFLASKKRSPHIISFFHTVSLDNIEAFY